MTKFSPIRLVVLLVLGYVLAVPVLMAARVVRRAVVRTVAAAERLVASPVPRGRRRS